jgi:hypothetical protein
VDTLSLALAVIAALAVVILLIIVATQARRIKRVETKVSLTGIGVSVELHELVKREVGKAAISSLGRLARIDRELIEIWEKKSQPQREDGEKQLSLLETAISEIERKLETAAAEDIYALASQLRELYWQLLQSARNHYASSAPYQATRARVMTGLTKIEALARTHE